MHPRTRAFIILHRRGPGDTYIAVGEETVTLSGFFDGDATACEDALRQHGPSADGQYIVQAKASRSARTFSVRTTPTIQGI